MSKSTNTGSSAFESDVPARENTKTEQAPVELPTGKAPSLKSKQDGENGGFGGIFEENLKKAFL